MQVQQPDQERFFENESTGKRPMQQLTTNPSLLPHALIVGLRENPEQSQELLRILPKIASGKYTRRTDFQNYYSSLLN